jgi:hypothetical protein
VQFDDGLGHRESDAQPFVGPARAGALDEPIEHAVKHLVGDADSVIAHTDDGLTASLFDREVHASPGSMYFAARRPNELTIETSRSHARKYSALALEPLRLSQRRDVFARRMAATARPLTVFCECELGEGVACRKGSIERS